MTVETLQTVMTNLQAQAHQNIVTLAQQHMDALKDVVNSNTRGRSSGGMTCIGRAVVFKGDDQRYGEWKAKLFAFLRVSTPQAMEWRLWARWRTCVESCSGGGQGEEELSDDRGKLGSGRQSRKLSGRASCPSS